MQTMRLFVGLLTYIYSKRNELESHIQYRCSCSDLVEISKRNKLHIDAYTVNTNG